MVKHVVKGPCSSKMRCKVNAGSPSVYKASRDFEFFDLPGGVTRSQTKRATICATPRRSRPQIPSAASVKLLYSKPAAGVKALRDLAREQHCRATIQIGQRGKEREKKVEGQSLHRV